MINKLILQENTIVYIYEYRVQFDCMASFQCSKCDCCNDVRKIDSRVWLEEDTEIILNGFLCAIVTGDRRLVLRERKEKKMNKRAGNKTTKPSFVNAKNKREERKQAIKLANMAKADMYKSLGGPKREQGLVRLDPNRYGKIREKTRRAMRASVFSM